MTSLYADRRRSSRLNFCGNTTGTPEKKVFSAQKSSMLDGPRSKRARSAEAGGKELAEGDDFGQEAGREDADAGDDDGSDAHSESGYAAPAAGRRPSTGEEWGKAASGREDAEADTDDGSNAGAAGAPSAGAGAAGADPLSAWMDLDGCETMEDVRRVVHSRFKTSQQVLDYIQTYKDTRLLKLIPLLMQRPRLRLPHVHTLDHACHLISSCKNILVLTGAGVSVSAGIPDFRSTDGIYRRLRDEFGMPTPECMFDREYFDLNPQPFFSFAHELWPGRFDPTPCHRFIRLLEKKGQLLRNYSQNIDTLEQRAGITRSRSASVSELPSLASSITCARATRTLTYAHA